MEENKMGTSITFIAIRKDKLKDAPLGVQNFAKDFLVEKDIFGIKCLVGTGTDDKSQWYEYDEEDKRYRAGLDPDLLKEAGIFTWFDKHPEICFQYFFI